MERTKWTDDLLDERMATVDEKLGHFQSEVAGLRKDMNTGFADLGRKSTQAWPTYVPT